MIKLEVSYENPIEEIKVLEALKKFDNKEIKKPKKKDKYYKMYIKIK